MGGGQHRPRQHVRLDIDHDDVHAVLRRRERMRAARRRRSGHLEHDLDIGPRDDLHPVISEIDRRDPLLAPPDRPAGGTRPVRIEIGDRNDPADAAKTGSG